MVDVPDDVAAQIVAILNTIDTNSTDPVVIQNYIDALTPEAPVVIPTFVEQVATFINDGVSNQIDQNIIANQIINEALSRLKDKLSLLVSDDIFNIIEDTIRYE